MLNYDLRQDDGILVLHPEGPLEAADFTSLADNVNAYLEGHGKLHGVLIHTKAFPGWKDFGGVMAAGFYGLPVMKPGEFLKRERAAGRLVP